MVTQEKMDKSEEKRLRKLQEENLKLRTELKAIKAGHKSQEALATWMGRHLSNFFVGRGLKGALARLYNELPGGVSKDTMADVSSHLIWRMTRLGFFAILVAIVPLLVMGVQTYILDIQNEKLEVQNQLILNQNRRLDQQIHLDEANRRSSFIFLMDNILSSIAEELKTSRDRRLSDALVGRIVSLTQALRPYRYLENDELTARQLSPERGQLLFALTNSLLHHETYDRIFERANFSYADLRDANFTDAYLRGANLAFSYFSYANFANADLAGADFSDAYLENARFTNTYLPGVVFQRTNLRRSQFVDVVMHDANLEECDMREVILSGNFSRCNLEGARIDEVTLGEVLLDDAFFHSPAWAEGLQEVNLRGFLSIEDYYRIEQVIERPTPHQTDTLYMLRSRGEQGLQGLSDCEKRVVELLYSAPKIRELDRRFQRAGYELLALPVRDSLSGVGADSLYIFRLALQEEDSLYTQLFVQFNPLDGRLSERSVPPVAIEYDQLLLKELPGKCMESGE